MIDDRTGQFISKQGLVLTYISHKLKSESIMKSNPKIQKLLAWKKNDRKGKIIDNFTHEG